MTKAKKHDDSTSYLEQIWLDSWTYIKTVVDVVREPVLILDKNLCVLAANEPFYNTFQVDLKETENKLVYKLGNGQWDIPDLRRLLEDILPKNTFFKGYKVMHVFPVIGRKIMILNARQIHYRGDSSSEKVPPIILLAIDDVTGMMDVAESFTGHIEGVEKKFSERIAGFEIQLKNLQTELAEFKKKSSR